MNKNQYGHFRYLLEQLRQEHMDVINDMLQGAPHGYRSHEDSELSRYDNHPADVATELFDTEHNAALKESEEFTVREIDDALNRIKDGTYGICELCGRHIDRKRLEVLPYARNCIDCETVREREKRLDEISKSKHRPVEEDVLEKVMRGDFLHDTEGDEPYEGRQALEEVLKYGSSDTPQDGATM
ncbi:MAG: transcriptional regulator, TraR/DksA family protein [Clostridiaceae bacterium]|nr:transcriptional regulator, TraR/DksA family protein [Clostridiaceae bacterium]